LPGPVPGETAGYYCGTTVGGKWSPHFRRGWTMDGFVEAWVENHAVCLRKKISGNILMIPLDCVVEVTRTRLHAFRIHVVPAVLFRWRRKGRDLWTSIVLGRKISPEWVRYVSAAVARKR